MSKRFIVWSPRVQNCMAWESRDMAERLAEFWRYAGMLGSRDWRVSPLAETAHATDAGTRRQGGDKMPPAPVQADAANDATSATHDELLELVARKDALIEELQRKLNENTLATVREAATQNRRIAELEQQVAAMSRGKAKGR